MKIYITRCYDHPFDEPRRATEGAAGLDLISTQGVFINPRDQVLLPTGFAWEIPFGYEGHVRPRSGLSTKHFLDVGAGTVDSDYRGEVMVLLRNFSSRPFRVQAGDRIAQMVVRPIWTGVCAEVAFLSDSERGEAGFGSTGVSLDHHRV